VVAVSSPAYDAGGPGSPGLSVRLPD